MKAKGEDDDFIDGGQNASFLQSCHCLGQKEQLQPQQEGGREGVVTTTPFMPQGGHVTSLANRNNNNIGGVGCGGNNDDSVPRVLSKTLAYKLHAMKEEIRALQD